MEVRVYLASCGSVSVSVNAGSSVLCQLLLRSVGPCRENVHIILFVPRGHCKCWLLNDVGVSVSLIVPRGHCKCWLLNDVGVCVSFECAGLCVSVCTCPSLFLHVFVSVRDYKLVPDSQ